MKLFSSLILSLCSVLGFSQTILYQPETTSRTVQDPQTVIMTQGFHAKSDASNSFLAKIGPTTENPGGGPTDSNAGEGNPSGNVPLRERYFDDTKGFGEVNGAGQFQFTVPITLPPGIKSVTPQISLMFNSSASNGIAGYGWNISGITSISRTGRNIEKDGEMKGVQLDYSDFYSFNGKRLILKSGEYGKDGAEYVTEKFSNIKIKSIGNIVGQEWKGPEYWEITFTDGSQAWYGAIGSGDSTARTPLDYNIVKWKDAQGNYITYNYIQNNNVSVISSIKWGGNETLGKSHFNEIEFNYNETLVRGLIEQSYMNGISFIQNKLLNTIIVKTNNSQYRKYDIIHRSDLTKYQFVEKIQEYNSENQPANPIIFYRTQKSSGENSFSDFNTLALTGDFFGNHSSTFIVNSDNMGENFPKGYYLRSQSNFGDAPLYYLGAENIYENAAPINIKDGDNVVSSKQGIVSSSIDLITRNLTLKYYLIDLTKPINWVTNSYPNALYLVGTKVIPANQWDESESYETPYPYFSYEKETKIKKLIPYDMEGDGVQELIIVKNNTIKKIVCPEVEDGLPSEEECKKMIYEDANKYVVIKQQDDSFPFFQFDLVGSDDLILGDFNGDGIEDIGKSTSTVGAIIDGESVPGNLLQAYNLKKNNHGQLDLSEVFSADYLGLASQAQMGDFNGDGMADLFVRTNINNHYIVNLNTGKSFVKMPYFNGFNATESKTEPKNGYYSTAKVLDTNGDGKSDIINFSTNYNIASSTSASSSYTVKISESHGYLDGKILFENNNPDTRSFPGPFIFREIVGLNQNTFQIYQPGSQYYKASLTNYSPNNLLNSLVDRIVHEGTATFIHYYDAYKPTKNAQYPLMELGNINSQLVSRLSHKGVGKLYLYRGLMINLHNRKTIGFRQMASAEYNINGPKLWSGIEIDPLNEGIPIKEWSIRTNNESEVFPEDISENNTQLLSIRSTIYQIDKLVNGQLVTTISDADKAKVVTSIVPKITKAKDFLTNTITTGETVYDKYYLPVQNSTNINNGLGIQTTTFEYTHNQEGMGINYFIGRPQSKITLTQAYGDTQSTKEEYVYENNLLKILKSWNRDNTGYLQATYHYDGFGNQIQKEISNSLDAQIQTTKAEYDSKGRFVVKKTDNLGLITQMEYNDWGQVTKQTDPLGNSVANIYDNWGKLTASKNNLGGTTTYQYTVLDETEWNSKKMFTQYNPDGGVSKRLINGYGQEYMTSSKAFGQGKFISKAAAYDGLGRKIRESEPFESTSGEVEAPTGILWNFIQYDDTVFPAKITTTALGKLTPIEKIESFKGKQIVTTVSGLTTTNEEVNGYKRKTSQTKDALDNIISSTDKGGTIQFSYNAAGEQIQAQYGDNIVTTKYDAWGRKIEFNDPSNGLYKYEYDGFGQIKKVISPKGTKEYTYNALGQLVSQKEISTIDNGETTNKNIAFIYDDKGRLVSKSGTSRGKTYSSNVVYDPQGRLLSSSESSNGKYFIEKGITYDDKARIISYEKQLYSSGVLTKVQIENVYNPWNGQLYQMKDKNSGKILWELQETNVKGQVTKAKLGEAIINNLYDEMSFLTNVNHSSQAKKDILQIHYSFDGIKGELRTRSTGGDFSIDEVFNYDDNNRLRSWTNPRTGQSSQNVYDVKGRILENDQVGTMKYGNPSKVYQSTGMTLNAVGMQNYNNDLIQSIVYNENNDPVFIDGMSGDIAFQYGLGSMRQRVTYGGNFSNDADGRFTKFYSEDGSYEVLRDNTTGKEKHIIYIGGSPYESNIIYLKNFDEGSGSYKFLHKDYLGSILAISDEAGNKLEQRHFDAWGSFTHLQIGNAIIVTDKNTIDYSSLTIDRGYTSHEHFGEVGIIHMNGRLYDPLLRRFLNADENIQSPTNTQNYNKYGYVMNNPMMYTDPSGEFWGFLIGMFVGSYLSGVQANHGNWNPVKWDWKSTETWTSVVGGALAGGSYGAGVKNVTSFTASRFIENSVVGMVGSVLNGIATGQNVFKSAIIGGLFQGSFSEINYIASNFMNSSFQKKGIANTYEQYLNSIGQPIYRYDLDEVMLTGKKAGGFGEGSYNGYVMERGMKNAQEDWNLDQARSRYYSKVYEFWKSQAISITVGGEIQAVVFNANLSTTLAFNLGDGKPQLFGSAGGKVGFEWTRPKFDWGAQLGFHHAYGTFEGKRYTDVFGGMEGESSGWGAAFFLGGEINRSSYHGVINNKYGVQNTYFNVLGTGYGFGRTVSNTVNIQKSIYHSPQFD